MTKYAKDSYCVDASEVLRHFHVDERKGLSPSQVDTAARLHGKNEIPPPPSTSLLKLIIAQFEDLLVLILLAAAVISFVLALFEDDGDDRWTAFVEPAVILIILVANAAVGVFQETNAAKAIEKLKQSEAREANVLRDGHTKTIHSVDVVPGGRTAQHTSPDSRHSEHSHNANIYLCSLFVAAHADADAVLCLQT